MKKGLKITLIVVLSLIFVAGASFGIVYATQGDYVKNKFAMMTKNDNEYFKWVYVRNGENNYSEIEKMKAALTPAEKSTNNTSILVSLSPEFGDLVGLSNFAGFENTGLKVGTVTDGNYIAEFSLTPVYNNVDILKVASKIDLENNELFMSAPTYKSDIIDLSEFFKTDLSSVFTDEAIEKVLGIQSQFSLEKEDFKDIPTLLKKYVDELSRMIKGEDSQLTPEKEQEYTERFRAILFDNLDEVTLDKDQKIEVNDIEAECNTLSVKIKKKTLIKMFKEFLDLYSDIIKEASVSDNENITKAFDELKKYLDDEKLNDLALTIDVVLDVDKKGDVIGGSFKIAVNESKIKLEILTQDMGENKTDAGIELSINDLKAFSTTVETYVDEEGYSVTGFSLKPGSFLSTILGGKKYELEINSRQKRAEESFDSKVSVALLDVTDAKKELVTLKIDSTSKNGVSEFSIDKANNNVIAASDILSSGYVDANALLQLVIDKLKEVNDDGLNNFLSSKLSGAFGGEVDIVDTLQQLLDSGYADMLTSQLLQMAGSGASDKLESNTAASDSAGNSISYTPATLDNDWLVDNIDNQNPDGQVVDDQIIDGQVDDDQIIAGQVDGQLPDDLSVEPDSQVVDDNFDVSSMDFEAEKDANGNYVYTFMFLKNIVNPLEYKGVTVHTYEDVENTPETAKSLFLSDHLFENYKKAAKGDTIAMGDKITFDAVAMLGKMALEDYSYTDVETQIGNYEYGAGIDDKLIGMKVGDSVTLKLTLDSRFGEFAGYTGDFKITVKSLEKWVNPEWTEEFIVDVLGYESLEACEEYVLANYLDKPVYDEELLKYQAFSHVSYSAVYKDISDSVYNRYLAWQDSYYMSRVGMGYKDYFTSVMTMYADDDMYSEFSDPDYLISSMIKDAAVYAYLADAEGVKVSQAELDAAYDEEFADAGLSDAERRNFLPEWMMVNSIIEKKIPEIILSYAIIEK